MTRQVVDCQLALLIARDMPFGDFWKFLEVFRSSLVLKGGKLRKFSEKLSSGSRGDKVESETRRKVKHARLKMFWIY